MTPVQSATFNVNWYYPSLKINICYQANLFKKFFKCKFFTMLLCTQCDRLMFGLTDHG